MGAVRRFSLGVFILCSLAIPPAVMALDGQVVYAEGTVTVTGGGTSQDAGPGTKVSAGDTMTTGADGLAVIDLSNATQIKLRENTSLVVDAIGDTAQVSLTAGGVFTHILKRLAGSFSLRAGETGGGSARHGVLRSLRKNNRQPARRLAVRERRSRGRVGAVCKPARSGAGRPGNQHRRWNEADGASWVQMDARAELEYGPGRREPGGSHEPGSGLRGPSQP